MTGSIRMTVPMMRRRQVSVNGKLVRLPPMHHAMLVVLMLNRGRTISRTELIEIMWMNPDDEPDTAVNLVYRYVYELRKVLPPGSIKTRIGFGVMMTLP